MAVAVAVVLLFANEPDSGSTAPATPGAAAVRVELRRLPRRRRRRGNRTAAGRRSGRRAVPRRRRPDRLRDRRGAARCPSFGGQLSPAQIRRRGRVHPHTLRIHPRKGGRMDLEIIVVIVVVVIVVFVVWKSFHSIGPTEVGLVDEAVRVPQARRRQPDRLPRRSRLPGRPADARAGASSSGCSTPWRSTPGCRCRPARSAWSSPRSGEPLPIGAKSARSYKPSSATSPTCAASSSSGGQKGVQRPVLPPGSLMPIHPVGFLVITRADASTALPVSPRVPAPAGPGQAHLPSRSASTHEQLQVTVITPRRPAAAGARHRAASSPRSRASRCRRAPSPAGSASSTTSSRAGRASNATDAELIEAC